jgi:hypothetical protein
LNPQLDSFGGVEVTERKPSRLNICGCSFGIYMRDRGQSARELNLIRNSSHGRDIKKTTGLITVAEKIRTGPIKGGVVLGRRGERDRALSTENTSVLPQCRTVLRLAQQAVALIDRFSHPMGANVRPMGIV